MINEYKATPRCEICGGTIGVDSVQDHHKKKRSQGGTNGLNNARMVHPFCNNNRDKLENSMIKARHATEIFDSHHIYNAPKPDLESIKQLANWHLIFRS